MEKKKNKINEKLKARNDLIDHYIEALKSDVIPWEQSWASAESPFNPVSKAKYHGINNLLLNIVSYLQGYTDPRWCTFKQASDNEWSIIKGSKATPVEYWMPYDQEQKKIITWKEYNEGTFKDVSLRCKTSYVFNAEQIDGIPEYEKEQNNQIYSSAFIKNLIKNMGVDYIETGDQAFYNSSKDVVVIPERELFKNNYGYYATQLHELSHATGHETRLNRKLKNSFGTEDYAKEELRAEIASSLLMQDLDITQTEYEMNNHAAYIKSWISILENEPNELFKAISEATDIQKYVEEKGELDKVRMETLEEFKALLSIDELFEKLFNDNQITSEEYEFCISNQEHIEDEVSDIVLSNVLNNEEIECDLISFCSTHAKYIEQICVDAVSDILNEECITNDEYSL